MSLIVPRVPAAQRWCRSISEAVLQENAEIYLEALRAKEADHSHRETHTPRDGASTLPYRNGGNQKPRGQFKDGSTAVPSTKKLRSAMEQTLGLWRARMSPNVKLTIGIILFPGFTQLDATGPHELLARLPNAEISLVALTKDVVTSERGLKLIPDKAFSECTSFDIVLVPGGPAIDPLLTDRGYVDFVKRVGASAKYIVSVCTGALLLGAAGLLKGYKATTHWLSLEFLSSFGATPMRERVVVDRNRITSAGVTAGIDMSLWLAAQLYGPQIAKTIQLIVQYQPTLIFPQSGVPETADAEIVAHIHDGRREQQQKRKEAVLSAAAKLTLAPS